MNLARFMMCEIEPDVRKKITDVSVAMANYTKGMAVLDEKGQITNEDELDNLAALKEYGVVIDSLMNGFGSSEQIAAALDVNAMPSTAFMYRKAKRLKI